ncbi:MAG: heme o synthase [Phycisphaerales bacterium JB040]
MSRLDSRALSETPLSARVGARVLMETTKQGISRLVTVTALVGYLLSLARWDAWSLGFVLPGAIGCVVGTWLSASGANALNMWLEGARDARMDRTRHRPIPAGRASPRSVAVFGTLMAMAGVTVLAILCGTPAALVSLACVASYVLVYTPLKTRTVWNTLAGTVPGALPALIGTAAATPDATLATLLDPFGLSLVALMVVWQLPHFMAIAWMYREDYLRGGYRMLSGADSTGRLTGWTMVATALLLIPCVILVGLSSDGTLAGFFVASGIVITLLFAWTGVEFVKRPGRATAKRVFLASVIVLPTLFLLMTGEAALRLVL